jgi:hypothetical protein
MTVSKRFNSLSKAAKTKEIGKKEKINKKRKERLYVFISIFCGIIRIERLNTEDFLKS